MLMPNTVTLSSLSMKANILRRDIIEMLTEAKSGHPAGALGMADIFAALFFSVLKHNPKQPLWKDRDRLVLSNGHICPVLYAAMAESGYFPKSELKTLRILGSRLQGHPSRVHLPGVETSSGSLGQGLSLAIGMALSARMSEEMYRVYCVMGDGEQQEGQVWEAFMFAGANKLRNLTVIIDRNNIQTDGFTEDVMPVDPLKAKYESFGWYVIEIDGHNIEECIDACEKAKAIFEKPTVIIAHTIPGKGVDFMQWDPSWHAKAPNKEQAKKALKELRTLKGLLIEE